MTSRAAMTRTEMMQPASHFIWLECLIRVMSRQTEILTEAIAAKRTSWAYQLYMLMNSLSPLESDALGLPLPLVTALMVIAASMTVNIIATAMVWSSQPRARRFLRTQSRRTVVKKAIVVNSTETVINAGPLSAIIENGP